MQAYLDLLTHILRDGVDRSDRTGTGTRGVFGVQNKYDLSKGFPILTTKRLSIHSIIQELLWFISGDTNIKSLQERKVTIWDEWGTPEQCARFGREPGDLGPIYGHQWRNFGASKKEDGSYNKDGFDQLKALVHNLKTDPYSRRHIVTGWNPAEASQVAIPQCQTLFQFYVTGEQLDCQLYQRSADVFLGVPYNIAEYAFLIHMLAHILGLRPGNFVHTIGDAHLYLNHLEQASLQVTRAPYALPELSLVNPPDDLFSWSEANFQIKNYVSHPNIKAPVSI